MYRIIHMLLRDDMGVVQIYHESIVFRDGSTRMSVETRDEV